MILLRILRFLIFLFLEARPTRGFVFQAKEVSSAIDQVLTSPMEQAVERWPTTTHRATAYWDLAILSSFIEEMVVVWSDVEIFQPLWYFRNSF